MSRQTGTPWYYRATLAAILMLVFAAALSLPAAGAFRLPLPAPPYRVYIEAALCLLVSLALAACAMRLPEFLLFCAGTDMEAIAIARSARTKQCGYGATILLTTILAFCSGSYVFQIICHDSRPGLALGSLWALIVFNMDRQIVATMRAESSFLRSLLLALPRFGLAALIAIAVSIPVELLFLAGRIDQRVADNRVAMGTNEKVITTDYRTRIDANNKDIKRLETLVETLRADRIQFQHAAAQIRWHYGQGGPPGAREQLQDQADRARQAQQDYEDARERLNAARTAGVTLENDLRNGTSSMNAARKNPNDFVDRVVALEQLSRENVVVRQTSRGIMLFLFILDLMPLVMKLVGNQGKGQSYEAALVTIEKNEAVLRRYYSDFQAAELQQEAFRRRIQYQKERFETERYRMQLELEHRREMEKLEQELGPSTY